MSESAGIAWRKKPPRERYPWVFNGKHEPPPIHQRTRAFLERVQTAKRDRVALHPDRQSGQTQERFLEAQALIEKLRRHLHVPVGGRVYARKKWWRVQRRMSGGWWECRYRKAVSRIHRREMTDARCGPNDKYRMISVLPNTRDDRGIPWTKHE